MAPTAGGGDHSVVTDRATGAGWPGRANRQKRGTGVQHRVCSGGALGVGCQSGGGTAAHLFGL